MIRSVILGFDVSPRRIAVAAIDQDNDEIVELALYKIDNKDDLRNRAEAIRQIVSKIRLDNEISAIFIEDAYPGKFRSTIAPHAISIGHCEALLYHHEPTVLITRIMPSTWRKILGLPQTGKEPIWDYANRRSDLLVGSQDEADAIAIATAGSVLFNKEVS